MRVVYLSLLLIIFSLPAQAQSYELLEAQQAFQNKQYQRTISVTQNILKGDSLNLNAHQLLPSAHMAIKQPILAEQSAEEGLHYYPKTTSLIWVKSEALLQRGIINRALPLYQQLLQLDSSIPKETIHQRLGLIYQSRGGKYFRQKKFDLAEENLKKAKEFMPDTLASYSNLALVYMQQERWEKALQIIDEARQRFPDKANLMRMRASALFETKNYEGVLDEYEKLYNKSPDELDTALPYAQLLLARGKKKEASKIYERLIKQNPEERKIYESLINFYDQRQNMQAKRSALQKMRDQFPNDASLMRRIAKTYKNEEQWELARAAYDTVQAMAGPSPALYRSIAQTFMEQDSLKAADDVYVEALKTYHRDKELLRLRGELQQQMEQWSAAEETYKNLTALSDSSTAYAALALVQLKLNKKDAAFSNFTKTINRETRDAEVYLQLAKLNLEGNNTVKAFSLGERALHLALIKVKDLQTGLTKKMQGKKTLFELKGAEEQAKALKQNNQLAMDSFNFITKTFSKEKVIPLMQTLQKDYPNSGRLLFMISSYYLDNKKNELGIDLLKESVRLSPNLADAHNALGQYYTEQDQNIQAIQAYERALSADPKNKEPYNALIELYRKIGQLDQLCSRWQARLRATPENSTLRDALIEALHKADRFEEAKKLIGEN